MTASKYIKARGLPSLAYVSGMVNKPPETLNNWYRDNFALFEVVVAGVEVMQEETVLNITNEDANKIFNAYLSEAIKGDE